MIRMLQQSLSDDRQVGFTIVELLIVIIVIAILAAITLVAFNGVQAKAENTKTLNAVETYIKAIKLYATERGSLPIHTNWPCLGGTSEICGASSTACWGVGYVGGQAAFTSDIKSYINTTPVLSQQSMACNPAGDVVKGGFYYSSDGQTGWVYYFLRGNVSCGNTAGGLLSRNQSQDATYCVITLNA
jgi:prepilin-type N-terminal cleavage/methylation domain-containing protein